MRLQPDERQFWMDVFLSQATMQRWTSESCALCADQAVEELRRRTGPERCPGSDCYQLAGHDGPCTLEHFQQLAGKDDSK